MYVYIYIRLIAIYSDRLLYFAKAGRPQFLSRPKRVHD